MALEFERIVEAVVKRLMHEADSVRKDAVMKNDELIRSCCNESPRVLVDVLSMLSQGRPAVWTQKHTYFTTSFPKLQATTVHVSEMTTQGPFSGREEGVMWTFKIEMTTDELRESLNHRVFDSTSATPVERAMRIRGCEDLEIYYYCNIAAVRIKKEYVDALGNEEVDRRMSSEGYIRVHHPTHSIDLYIHLDSF